MEACLQIVHVDFNLHSLVESFLGLNIWFNANYASRIFIKVKIFSGCTLTSELLWNKLFLEKSFHIINPIFIFSSPQLFSFTADCLMEPSVLMNDGYVVSKGKISHFDSYCISSGGQISLHLNTRCPNPILAVPLHFA